jgi:hypothetical protein
MVICLTGDIALSSPYRFIEKIFPPSDEFLSNANESFKCDSPFYPASVCSLPNGAFWRIPPQR